MGIPVVQMYRIARYILEQKLKGNKRYPLVLMLEPLFQCNLACSGCGKIDYPDEILRKRMSVEDALKAVDECGAPVVSIPGGEPLIHKEMPQIVEGIIARKKFVYLCTNALLLEQKLDSRYALLDQKIDTLRGDVTRDLAAMDLRMTVKLGSMMFLGFGATIAALRLWL